jgi:hypothetical protein
MADDAKIGHEALVEMVAEGAQPVGTRAGRFAADGRSVN